MLISFGELLSEDIYTVTISDAVQSLGGTAIDGDADGLSGGDAIFTMEHRSCQPSVPAISEWGNHGHDIARADCGYASLSPAPPIPDIGTGA